MIIGLTQTYLLTINPTTLCYHMQCNIELRTKTEYKIKNEDTKYRSVYTNLKLGYSPEIGIYKQRFRHMRSHKQSNG